MKSYRLLLPLIIVGLLSQACTPAADKLPASTIQQKEYIKTSGRVDIALEPHGSIRAKVVEGQSLKYEYILDREKQQDQLTQSIAKADVYLLGNLNENNTIERIEGLVIDDTEVGKRHMLSMRDISAQAKALPGSPKEIIPIKGYSSSMTFDSNTFQ